MEIKQVFATRLKALREKKGMSQTELANEIGISRGSISFYENGERTADIEILNKLCDYFRVSADYLIGAGDLAQINEFNLTNKHYKSNATLDSYALEIYRLMKECFSEMQNIESFIHEQDQNDSQNYTAELCRIVHAHMQRDIVAYISISNTLFTDFASTHDIITAFLNDTDINDIQRAVIDEIFKFELDL